MPPARCWLPPVRGVGCKFGVQNFQFLFHFSALGHILGGPDHPDRLAGAVGYGHALGMDDAGDSIGTDDTIVNIIWGLMGKGLLDRLVYRLPVIGMDPFQETVI